MPAFAALGTALFGTTAATVATLGTAASIGASVYGANKQAKTAEKAANAQAAAEDEKLKFAQQNAEDRYNYFAPIARDGARFVALSQVAAGGRPTQVRTMPSTYAQFRQGSSAPQQQSPYLPQNAPRVQTAQAAPPAPQGQSYLAQPSRGSAHQDGDVKQMKDGNFAKWNAQANRFEAMG
jgi:hypothetical protein